MQPYPYLKGEKVLIPQQEISQNASALCYFRLNSLAVEKKKKFAMKQS